MKRTGNTIVAKLFVGDKFQDVPIMRNGKPTKRTKREYVSEYADVELTGIEVQGHEIFINENEKHYNGETILSSLPIMVKAKESQSFVNLGSQAKPTIQKLLITMLR
jgi:hypothetical protein